MTTEWLTFQLYSEVNKLALTSPTAWATYPATTSPNLNTQSLCNVNSVVFSPGGILTTPDGSNLTWNSSPVGGGGSPSNWSSFPATTPIDCGGNAIQGGFIDSSGTPGGKPLVYWNSETNLSNFPLIQFVQTNGGGFTQPSSFVASSFTYIKNDPGGNPTERFSLQTTYNGEGNGWTIGSVWEGYIGIPLTIGGTPIIFSVGGNDSQQIFINSENGGSGRMWVDSNGALYWNSNLLANA